MTITVISHKQFRSYICKFSIFLLILAASLQAASLGGSVTDPSGALVQQAQVSAVSRDGSLRFSAVSGADGTYSMRDLPAGEYLVSATAPELYGAAGMRIRLERDSDERLDIRLQLAGVSTEVLVTAAGVPQIRQEVSKSVDVIDHELLESRAEFRLSEALRSAPGTKVRQLGGPGQLVTIQSRGMRAYDTALLLDGFRLRDPSSPQGDNSGFLSDILLLDVDRVEMLRGSGSSLYGTHAMGGVVNVVTDSGSGPLHGSVLTEGGGLGFLRGAASLAGSAAGERVHFSLGAGHVNVMDGVDGNDPSRNSSGQGHLDVRLGANTSLSGRILTADTFLGLNASPYVPSGAALPALGPVPAAALEGSELIALERGRPWRMGSANFIPGTDDPDSRRASRLFTGLLTLRHRWSESASFRLDYQGLSTRRDVTNGPGGLNYQPEFNNADRYSGRIDDVNARADWQPGTNHLITFGYEFERERFENITTDENPDPAFRTNATARIRQSSHSLYAASQSRFLSDRLQLSLGGRVQRFSLAAPSFEGGPVQPYSGMPVETPPTAYTGDVSLAYLLRGGTKLRGHAGNAYRAPSLYERYGASFFFGSFSPLGDPRLRPERSIAADAGIDHYFSNGRFRASGTYFYTRLQEIIEFDFSGAITPDTDPFGRWGGYRNTSGGLARGAELSFEATPLRSLRVSASYTYTNARLRRPFAADGDTRALGISRHMMTAFASYRILRNIDIAFNLYAAGDYTYPFFASAGSRTYVFHGPVKGDVTVSYTLPVSERRQMRFYSRLENAFNRTYYEDGFRTPGAWAVGGVQLLF